VSREIVDLPIADCQFEEPSLAPPVPTTCTAQVTAHPTGIENCQSAIGNAFTCTNPDLLRDVFRTLSQQDASILPPSKRTFRRHKCCSISCDLFRDSEKEISMSDPNINKPLTGTTPGTTGTPATTGTPGTTGSTGGSTGTGTAPALSQTAHEYGQKLTEVATQAKDFVADKVSVVSDKFKDLQNADLGELAENAKDYARRKPGQALLISAAVGLVLGLLVRRR
jgi:ElaB/YqjD/DUF883 family membrane-anchored ribosome-binding protein